MRAKGNADCHIPNDAYREGWDRIFGKAYYETEVDTAYIHASITPEEWEETLASNGVAYDFNEAMDNLLGRKEWPGTEYIKRPANVDINVVSE